jgi:alpha-L-fucosidase
VSPQSLLGQFGPSGPHRRHNPGMGAVRLDGGSLSRGPENPHYLHVRHYQFVQPDNLRVPRGFHDDGMELQVAADERLVVELTRGAEQRFLAPQSSRHQANAFLFPGGHQLANAPEFDHEAGIVKLSEPFGRHRRDEGSALRMDHQQAFVAQPVERLLDGRPAHIEAGGEVVDVELLGRRQGALHDLFFEDAVDSGGEDAALEGLQRVVCRHGTEYSGRSHLETSRIEVYHSNMSDCKSHMESPPADLTRKEFLLGALSASALPGQVVRPAPYEPAWASLDSRPIPSWFDDAKIGVFLHWGVFSVPAVAWVYPDKRYGFGGHSCWYGMYVDRIYPLREPAEQAKLEAFHRKNYGNVGFRELAPLFKAEAYEPERWADLFRKAGVRWATLTSNFHDGFCIWPSPYSPGWNSVETGPKRDLLGDFTAAVRAAGLRSGFYYSLAEFNHPLYPKPEKLKPKGDLPRFVREHMQPQLREVVRRYAPSFIYLDGEWEYPEDAFEMKPFLAWLYNESPCRSEVVINDRFFKGSRGKHGTVYSSEAGVNESGTAHKWMEDRPISRGNWSYNRLERPEDYLSERDLIHLLVKTVAEGGNLHLALSPCADGTIPMLQQERLLQLGEWLGVNGEAIYETRKWRVTHEGPMVETCDPHLDSKWNWVIGRETPLVHYTSKGGALYAIALAWPGRSLKLSVPRPGRHTEVRMLGYPRPLSWKMQGGSMNIEVPPLSVAEVPCRHAWVFKVTGAEGAA